MLKLIRCEFWKIKRKKLFHIAFLTTFIMPVFYFMIIKDANLDNLMSVVQEENGFLVLIPLSIILAASLYFEEQDHDTLKNLLCVPVTRRRLSLAKLFVVLVFDIAYELAGFFVSLLLALLSRIPLTGTGRELLLTIACGALLWAASMPCLLLVIWCNRSYIISVIIAFAYTMLGYILHISDAAIRVPLGLNIPTLLPVPVIFRWLYQFHSLEDAGPVITKFYESFSPYFVPTPTVFAILMGEALLCIMIMIKIYERQKI